MKKINSFCFEGKRVLIRVDFNVPLNSTLEVSDTSRIIAALPTIKKVVNDGGKAIVMSHLGRPENKYEECFSMKHVLSDLKGLVKAPVFFSNDCIGENPKSVISKMPNSSILLLENLRFYPEEKKADYNFAKKLSELGDFFINDAFGVAHRKHASNAILPKFFNNRSCFGFLLSSEINQLNKVLQSQKRPVTAIIGGAKVSGKIEVIQNLIQHVDNLIIGGGMAYTFIKALGGDVGSSILEKDKVLLATKILSDAKLNGVNLLLPVDSVNAKAAKNNATIKISKINKINAEHMGLDVGPESVLRFTNVISSSKTIVWNGPMGVFEIDAFSKGTVGVAKAVASATNNGAFSIVGGGDSISAIKRFNFESNISYISTGGGAMLKYLEGSVLPAISAIQD